MKLSNLLRRDPAAPSLRERAAALRDRLTTREPDTARRAMLGGALAAAVPLPAMAASVPPLSTSPHPDAELLALGEKWLQARVARDEAMTMWGEAWQQVCAVRITCPPDLFALKEEQRTVLGGWRWPTLLGVNLRHIYLDWGKPEGRNEQAWTGEALRIAIERAVPMLGRGGKTPGRIRRWKAMLPIADAFDARIEAIETATGFPHLEQLRKTTDTEFRNLTRKISQQVATTPEGMAAIVRIIGCYPWKDTGGAWGNLLRSAALVAGIDPASLEHENDTIRLDRA